MKMVKSLLLGSAAGVVAVAGAQAADLPVKAKAVEYVKICSLYGAGFYYIPGTDICMKVGGYVRFQENWSNGGSSISNGPAVGVGGRDNRLDSQDWIMRTRAVATFDTRQQTQYGVLRTYLLLGFQQDSSGVAATTPPVYMTRGFIQFAGFTFGKATSYFDFFPRAAIAYHAGSIFAADTGDAGQMVAAYTAQFGGGVSASISAENTQNRGSTVFSNAAAYGLGVAPVANDLGGVTFTPANGGGSTFGVSGNPDIVANIRWEGTWGAFQLAGVLHDVSAGYYGTNEQTGHPSNKWGWAIEPGLRLNAPMFGAGDYFVVNYIYAVGATRFAAGGNQSASGTLIWNGQSVGYGMYEDGVYAAAGSIELTTAWSVAAAYEHFWSPALQTSLYGSYMKMSHNATSAAIICTSSVTNLGATAACNPDWSQYNIGSRTQWNVVKGLYVGLDVLYTKLKSATNNAAGTVTVPVSGAKAAGVYNVADQSAWAFAFRVHRDIVP